LFCCICSMAWRIFRQIVSGLGHIHAQVRRRTGGGGGGGGGRGGGGGILILSFTRALFIAILNRAMCFLTKTILYTNNTFFYLSSPPPLPPPPPPPPPLQVKIGDFGLATSAGARVVAAPSAGVSGSTQGGNSAPPPPSSLLLLLLLLLLSQNLFRIIVDSRCGHAVLLCA